MLLHTFFQNCPKKEDLSVTFLVIGLPKNDKCYKVSIVNGKDLKQFELDMETITSMHIYSIQSCVELTDLNVLYAAQKEEIPVELISKGISAIDFKCNERDDNLLSKLKLNALPTSSLQPTSSQKADSHFSNFSKSPTMSAKVDQNINVDQSNHVTNSEKNKKSIPNPEVKNLLVHPMFKSSITSKKKTNEKVPANIKRHGGIGAFFKTAKPCDKPSNNVPDVTFVKETISISEVSKQTFPKTENTATVNSSNGMSNKVCVDSVIESARNSNKPNAKPKFTSKKLDTKKCNKSSVKKTYQEEKKRKRLVVMSDSESNGSEDEKEVEREPTPEPQPSLLPDENGDDMISGTPEPSRKRKKKLVSKSFASPDGYLMTEKVYVSCSEEEEMPIKKCKESAIQDKNCDTNSEINTKTSSLKKEAVTKNKNSSPQKVKQSSLMTFFKKK